MTMRNLDGETLFSADISRECGHDEHIPLAGPWRIAISHKAWEGAKVPCWTCTRKYAALRVGLRGNARYRPVETAVTAVVLYPA